jgi:hypothetical protein
VAIPNQIIRKIKRKIGCERAVMINKDPKREPTITLDNKSLPFNLLLYFTKTAPTSSIILKG